MRLGRHWKPITPAPGNLSRVRPFGKALEHVDRGRGSFHGAMSEVMVMEGGRVIDRRAPGLAEFFSDRALRMREMSLQHWGQDRDIELIGR